MARFQRPRGTQDLLPGQLQRRRAYLQRVRQLLGRWGYGEVLTPTFEHLELFEAKSGAGVREELYAFKDKSGRDLALRPELTAAVMRAYLEGMGHLPKPLKLYYVTSCFRYENPQAGRYREFWQIGTELLGADPLLGDVEMVALAWHCLAAAEVPGLQLRLGHLGLVRALLAASSVQQPEGVLRLLDKGDRAGLDAHLRGLGAPDAAAAMVRLMDHRTDSSAAQLALTEELAQGVPDASAALAHLQAVLPALAALGVPPPKLDLAIARGFDYYTGLVFEVDAPQLGAEKQVCGGGGYELLQTLGGEALPTTGFALGLDRVLLAQEQQRGPPPALEPLGVLMVPMGPEVRLRALELVQQLRAGYDGSVEIDLAGRSLTKALKYADARQATAAVILGPKEAQKSVVTLRWLHSGEQAEVPQDRLLQALQAGPIGPAPQDSAARRRGPS